MNSKNQWWQFVVIGVVAGFLSGLFGIGGGTVIVPALVLWISMDHRIAAGTSVAAILPMAVSGSISYAVQGHVDWIAAVLLAAGIIVGAQVGSMLLAKLPVKAIQWTFLLFLLVIIVSLWFIVPQREDSIALNLITGLFLALTGFITGVLSGILGVGGGVIVVPVLMFFFGSSDLIAKGTSLVMMIPGSISATLGNLRRSNIDMRGALYIGAAGVACAPLGSLLAGWIDPLWGNIAFSLYLLLIFGQLLQKQVKKRK